MWDGQVVRTGALGAILLGVALLSPPELRGQATIGGEWRTDVATFADRVVDAELVPGMAIAVARGDWVVYEEGFGTADRRTGRRVSPATRFYIASSTKSLTALAVSLAADRGELDLDAPLTRHLPDARLPDGADPDDLTLRRLLTMTHGLDGSGPIVLLTAYVGEYDRDDLPELLRFHPPTGEAGSFSYNNLGYNLLGMVLEEVYGVSWKEVVRREVLQPLGMVSTSAYRSRLDPDRIAYPHSMAPAVPGGGEDGGSRTAFERIRLVKDDGNLHAAGGHFTTAGDLARYVAAHLGGGTLDGDRVLPEGPVRLTHEAHVAQDRRFGPYQRFGWGWGWDLGTVDGDTILHRFGAFAGYRSHMSLMPAEELGVVVLVNGDGPASPASDLVARYVYDRLRGHADLEATYGERLEELVGLAERARGDLADHRAERAGRMAPLAHPLEAYAGTYENQHLGRMTWRVVAGGLEAHIGLLEGRAEVFDADEDQLRVELTGGGTVVDFSFEEDGGPATSLDVLGYTFRRSGS